MSSFLRFSDFTVCVCFFVVCSGLFVVINSDSEEIMSQRSNSVDIQNLQDIRTPFGVRLSGVYKRSFAYITIKDRLPVILTKVIDTLSCNKDAIAEKYGPNATEEIKQMVGFISKLKSEVATNKALKPIRLLDNVTDNDALEWNKCLEKRTEVEGETPTWFNTLWLYCECYMYRTLAQEFLLTKTLYEYDPFELQKKDGFINSLGSIENLAKYMLSLINTTEPITNVTKKLELFKLLKLNLWGNRCDLSLSAGADVKQSGNPVELLESFDKDILVNDSNFVWEVISKKPANGPDIVDIICDNAGYELFTDLCLATFFVTHDLAQKVRFYVKRYPWYVSDTTVKDFRWTLQYMQNSSSSELKTLAKLANKYLEKGIWTIEEEAYWTGPYEFAEMKERDKKLYAKLSEAKLAIFKGDLNYRKLLSDINWEYTTTFAESLRGFQPTNILSLRTVKADLCVGLPAGKAESMFEKNERWMFTGQYGLIQTTMNTNCECSYKQ